MNKEKLEIIHSWVSANVDEPCEISVASNDASFRSYWRLSFDNDTKILMHAPPKLEPLESFLDINIRLGSIGINVPKILKTDKSKGFILMSDLGNKKYLDVLNDDTVYCLYTDAIDAICKMQKEASTENLKTFDIEEQKSELDIFRKWFLNEHLKINDEIINKTKFNQGLEILQNKVDSIPKSFVHRDFHSRNLMMTKKNNPGVLDHQDAVIGPITYDIVSLLKDCYITWDEKLTLDMLHSFSNKIKDVYNFSFEEFEEWYDIAGLQRHLKAIGIFSRLNHRDNKTSYLSDIPRTYAYVEKVLEKYPYLIDIKSACYELEIKNLL